MKESSELKTVSGMKLPPCPSLTQPYEDPSRNHLANRAVDNTTVFAEAF